jgi:hypothetical protein
MPAARRSTFLNPRRFSTPRRPRPSRSTADKGFRTAPLIRLVGPEDGLLAHTHDGPRWAGGRAGGDAAGCGAAAVFVRGAPKARHMSTAGTYHWQRLFLPPPFSGCS